MMMKRIVRHFPVLLLLAALTFLLNRVVSAEPDAPAEIEAFNWDTDIRLSTLNAVAERPNIKVAANGTITVAYLQRDGSNSNDYDAFFRTSTDHGVTWSTPARIKNTPTRARQVDIAINSANVAHAVWTEGGNILGYAPRAQWNGNASYTKIADLSAEFPFGIIENPKIFASGTNSTLDVVWSQASESDQSRNIFHSRSVNGGSWSIPKIASNGGVSTFSTSGTPDITVTSNGHLNIVWEEQILGGDNAVYYGRSTNGGGTWSQAVNLSQITGATNAIQPRIINDGNVLHVVFGNRLNANSQFVHHISCSSNCTNANNWKASNNPVSGQAVGANTTDPFDVFPTIATKSGCLLTYFHGIKSDISASNELIWGVSSCTSWGNQRELVTNPARRAIKPAIAVENNWFVYLAYEEAEQNEVRFIRTLPALYMPLMMRQYVAGP